jgi:hypothetical protein
MILWLGARAWDLCIILLSLMIDSATAPPPCGGVGWILGTDLTRTRRRMTAL